VKERDKYIAGAATTTNTTTKSVIFITVCIKSLWLFITLY